MLHANAESTDGGSFRTFGGLLLLILLLLPSGAPSELICSHQPIVALAGDDVILPCHLEPAVSAESVEWTRPGLDPKYIHVHRDGRLLYEQQNPSYHFRTRLFVDKLTNGNVSMKIFRVTISDAGEYKCVLPSMLEEASIQLTVGAVSTPVIQVVSNISGRVTLDCRSAGWYPEPEVLWLDAEGKLLSAGPPEAVRGPDGLYTVSSRVTVEERHGSSFTCRVQQKDINQSRETHVHVPAHGFVDQSSSSWIWIIIIVSLGITALLFIIIIIVIMIIKRIKKSKDKDNDHDKDKNQIEADGPELSRLTGQKKELENQEATGEGAETADHQRNHQREAGQTNTERKTEEPLENKHDIISITEKKGEKTKREENVKCDDGEDRGTGEDT